MNQLTAQDHHDHAVAKVQQKQSALAAMANRLQISPASLQKTLLNTVFKKASEDEFAALVIVANEYGLNPLTKEIYAFPANGGITPIVSVDGWIRIMNEHPQFDGIEFNDIQDSGKLIAIEAVIHRKDRKHPIKVTEYLDECQKGTDPWKKWPSRMLRHKALIQGARIAFGFSGIHDDEESVVYMGGDLESDLKPARVPSNRELEDHGQADDTPHDEETGEVVEHSDQVDQRSEEEVAQELDEAKEEEPPTERQHRIFEELMMDLQAATTPKEVVLVRNAFDRHINEMHPGNVETLEREITAKQEKMAA